MAFPALYKEIPYQDPASVFPRLEQENHPLFLDSAMTDPRLGRVSYLAVDPFIILEAGGGAGDNPGDSLGNDYCLCNGEKINVGPVTCLTDLLDKYKLDRLDDAAVPLFQGGAAGLFSYDLAWHLEKLPTDQDNNAGIPELAVGFYDLVLAFDHNRQRGWIIATGQTAENPVPDVSHAEKRLSYGEHLLSETAQHDWPDQIIPPLTWTTDLNRQQYEQQVQKVIDYIYAGDIFQANLSQQFRAILPEGFNPLAFYKNLRKVNAATFAGYFKTDTMVIASSSPERFIKVEDGQAETRPIKGTRPRFADPIKDRAAAADLLAAEKDRAENVMIVDLLRNDLSKNCAPHTIAVPELCALESYASVHHLVSSVTGRLKPGRSSFQLLSAAFPGGSITGAPKLRAMEIIAELEPWRRGAYCGALGFISFAGDMDSSVLIRTVTLKDGVARFNVGGGIVAESIPATEYDETLIKAQGIFAAFDAMSSEQGIILSASDAPHTSRAAS